MAMFAFLRRCCKRKLTSSNGLLDALQDFSPFSSVSSCVSSPSDVASGEEARRENRELRINLAAAFRESDRLGFNEAIDNHLSVMAPAADGSGKQVMLINPFGRFWSKITASSLLGIDASGKVVEGSGLPLQSSWAIHHTVHHLVPKARCLLHVHTTYATALACLEDPTVKLLHSNSAIVCNAIVYDNKFSGFACSEEEGIRLAEFLKGEKTILMQGNHGVLVSARDIPTAFFNLFYLERSCQFQVLALSTGKKLNELKWSAYNDGDDNTPLDYDNPEEANTYFDCIKSRLEEECPEFMN